MKRIFQFLGILTGSVLLPLSFTAAQSCGDFIYTNDSDDGNGLVEEREPIEDCANPFGRTDEPKSTSVSLAIGGQPIQNDAVVTVVTLPTNLSIELNPIPEQYEVFSSLVRHEGVDYRYLSESVGSAFEFTATGTYSLITQVQEPFSFSAAEPTFRQKIQQLFLPVAHAQIIIAPTLDLFVTTFTIALEQPPKPKPPGASSVLFLPGLQASRLYTDGVLGTENQLWEPNRNDDVEKLAMSESGESLNDIYTRDVLDEVNVLPLIQGNIYKSFLSLLEEIKKEGAIQEYVPFAYDWRFGVFDVATKPIKYPNGETKLLLDEVKKLATQSHTGKVTIIAHSNGGLVAKALLHEYGEEELAGLVDKVIMVGTPQLGTPKAVGSLLHGLEQHSKLRLVYNQPTSRETTKYMPGAYGLLPTSKFIVNNAGSIITADNSEIAAPVSGYGDISVYDNFIDFLIDKQNSRNEVINVTQPISLEANLLADTIQSQQILDNWVTPDGVEIYEVAGTGLTTIKGFNYREFSCKDTNPNCILTPFLKPTPTFTTEGDETVVLDSATAYDGNKVKLVVDLRLESAGLLNNDIKHSNLTESNSVKAFTESVIKYPYLTDTIIASELSLISSKYTIIAVHSPVLLSIKNEDGQVVEKVSGEIKEEIAGASYFEFAGSKYVVVPTEEKVSVLLQGESTGRYSLTIEELDENGKQTLLQEIIGATSTETMVGEFDCVDGVCGKVVVDYDADGESDVVFDWVGSYRELSTTVEVVEEKRDNRGGGQSSGTRVGDRLKSSGVVAGVSTTNQQVELLRMWNILLEIQATIDELKVYYNLN